MVKNHFGGLFALLFGEFIKLYYYITLWLINIGYIPFTSIYC